jgi:hypothetical protein
MRLLIQSILVFTLMPMLASAAQAEPLVSIVFSANNGGNITPCPVCGNKALGGLARRATAFENIRKSSAASGKAVFIGGPYEFLTADTSDAPTDAVWSALPKAFERLGYSSGCVSPSEAKALADRGLSLPPNWRALGKDVQSQILETPNGKIGLVFFPVLNTANAEPSPETIDMIVREAKKLKPSAKLLVGISGWGVSNEGIYLDKAPPVLDVLLGSADGVGFSAKPSPDSKTLWMRSYTKGKALYVLDLLAWPSSTAFSWEPGSNYNSQALLLDTTFASDQAMDELLQVVAPQSEKTK